MRWLRCLLLLFVCLFIIAIYMLLMLCCSCLLCWFVCLFGDFDVCDDVVVLEWFGRFVVRLFIAVLLIACFCGVYGLRLVT